MEWLKLRIEGIVEGVPKNGDHFFPPDGQIYPLDQIGLNVGFDGQTADVIDPRFKNRSQFQIPEQGVTYSVLLPRAQEPIIGNHFVLIGVVEYPLAIVTLSMQRTPPPLLLEE